MDVSLWGFHVNIFKDSSTFEGLWLGWVTLRLLSFWGSHRMVSLTRSAGACVFCCCRSAWFLLPGDCGGRPCSQLSNLQGPDATFWSPYPESWKLSGGSEFSEEFGCWWYNVGPIADRCPICPKEKETVCIFTNVITSCVLCSPRLAQKC